MKRLLLLIPLVATLAACGPAADPPEGCRGHGGVVKMSNDATNSKLPFACKDGTVGTLNV